MQFSGVYGIYAVEPILPELGISGITPFAHWLTQNGVESNAHSSPQIQPIEIHEGIEHVR